MMLRKSGSMSAFVGDTSVVEKYVKCVGVRIIEMSKVRVYEEIEMLLVLVVNIRNGGNNKSGTLQIPEMEVGGRW